MEGSRPQGRAGRRLDRRRRHAVWLTDRTPKALAFARNYLLHYNGDGTGTDGHAKATGIDTTPKAYTAAGLRKVLVGRQVLAFTGARAGDPRVPDLIGIVQHGVVYTGGTKKIAEHGGDDPQDRHVPLVVRRHAGRVTSSTSGVHRSDCAHDPAAPPDRPAGTEGRAHRAHPGAAPVVRSPSAP